MNNQDYESIKRSYWNGLIRDMADRELDPYTAFSFAFDRAYALGKQEKVAKKPKRMCLRDKSKVCNQCHECDIDPDAWYSMYNR